MKRRRCTFAISETREREKASALRTQDRNEKQETIDAQPADSLKCNDLSGAQKFLCRLSLSCLSLSVLS